jgi:hypothetical protein
LAVATAFATFLTSSQAEGQHVEGGGYGKKIEHAKYTPDQLAQKFGHMAEEFEMNFITNDHHFKQKVSWHPGIESDTLASIYHDESNKNPNSSIEDRFIFHKKDKSYDYGQFIHGIPTPIATGSYNAKNELQKYWFFGTPRIPDGGEVMVDLKGAAAAEDYVRGTKAVLGDLGDAVVAHRAGKNTY